MTTITISQKTAKNKDLIAIPRKEYEILLGAFKILKERGRTTSNDISRWSKEAKKLLMAYNATEALLSIAVPVGSKDRYKSYALSNKPYVVVVYGEKNGREVVRELSLYYEVEHIGHPDNKWLNVEEIDLRNISLDSGR